MKVRALILFEDYLEDVTRHIGDVFEVTEERYQEILTKGGSWVEEVLEEETQEEAIQEDGSSDSKSGKKKKK